MFVTKPKTSLVISFWVQVILVSAPPSLALNTEDVLRVYLDPGLSAMTVTTAAVPDTITACLVLENPTVAGNLTVSRFDVLTSRSTLLGINSAHGVVTKLVNYRYELVADSPVPLGATTLLADLLLAVDSPGVGAIDVFGGVYDLDTGGSKSTNQPFWIKTSAWINPGLPLLSVGPPLVFPAQGTNRTERGYANLANDGDGPAFLSPEFGPGCEAFLLLNPEILDVIPPNFRTHAEIQFAPSVPGEYQCEFSFSPGYAVGLQGIGRTPVNMLSGPTAVDFGAVAVGGIAYESIEVTNDGDYDVGINPAQTVTCGHFSHFFPNSIRTIVPGQKLTLTLTFAAPDFDLHECNATFGGGLLDVALTGTGIEGTMAAHASPDTGVANVGAGGQANILIRLVNDGDVFIFPDFQLVDPDGVFTLTDSLPASIEPAKYGQYQVLFAPSEARDHTGELLLGPGLPTVPLVGHGLLPYPALEASPTPLVFPPTNPARKTPRSFTSKTPEIPFCKSRRAPLPRW